MQILSGARIALLIYLRHATKLWKKQFLARVAHSGFGGSLLKTYTLHSLAVSWTGILNRYAKREGKDLQKMVLGMEILLHNIPKIFLMIAVASLLGILTETLMTWLPFAFVRRYASGLHAKTGISCTVVTLLMFVGVPYILQNVYINEAVLFLLFLIIGFGVYKYAPADTAARPLIGKKKRARLKRQAVGSIVIIFAVALVLQNGMFYALIAFGCLCALAAILPLTYKILKRRMNNYEQYE